MSKLNKSERIEPETFYIPVQILEEYSQKSSSINDEIDIIDIIKRIWDGKKSIIKITVAFVIIGILYAISIPNEYSTSVKLLPELQNNANNLGRLGGLAAQFGLGGAASATGTDVLPAQLYPEILSSTDFLLELVSKQVYFEELNDSISIETYFNEHQKSNLLVGYTIGLPFKLLSLIRSSPDDESVDVLQSNTESYRRISQNVMLSILSLRQSIEQNRDQQTGILTLSVTTQSPEVTVQIANHLTQALSNYLTEYRTEKSRRNLQFIEQRHAEARTNFELEQDKLAKFRDQNQGNLTAAAQTTEQNIQSEYNVKLNVYNSLTEQLEQSRIKLHEDTPVVNVIQESIYPNRKSGPKRLIILVAFGFIGVLFSIFWVLQMSKYFTLYKLNRSKH